MSQIEFIYFDLGNVILNFDHRRAWRQAAEVAGCTPAAVEAALATDGWQDQYETGLLSSAEFHQKFCEVTGSQPELEPLLNAISDIFWPLPATFPLLCQLRACGVPMGILSNTCEAHWQFVQRRYRVLQQFFSPIVLSYEERSMKPAAKIYQSAIAAAGVAPKRIFFTDDRQENVDGAIAAGLDATLFTSVPDLVAQLRARGVECNL